MDKPPYKVGFLVWNQFQIAHFAEMAKQFHEPDFILIDRDVRGFDGFDPSWLIRYGAFTRFIREVDLSELDGAYDAILTQFTPPFEKPWKKTKLVMCQYSMAKPKTVYNARWLASDFGLVYGAYAANIIGNMCPVAQVGNPRFDPIFEGRLESRITNEIQRRLDSNKKTILFLPTWGDLSAKSTFEAALRELTGTYNVLFKPHHLSPIREDMDAKVLGDGVLGEADFEPALDIGMYFMNAADLVVSDMSGAIFDALYCRKPVVLLSLDTKLATHKKAGKDALEVAERKSIGTLVKDPLKLGEAVASSLYEGGLMRRRNEVLAGECFVQRGGCAPLVANALDQFLMKRIDRPNVHLYAGPRVRSLLLRNAYDTALRKLGGETTAEPDAVLTARADASSAARAFGAVVVDRVRTSITPLLENLAERAEGRGYENSAKRLNVMLGRWGSPKALNWLADRAQSAGNVRSALHYYSRAANATALPKPEYVKLLHLEGNIFEVGIALEKWSKAKIRRRTSLLSHYVVLATKIRFSQKRYRAMIDGLAQHWSKGGGEVDSTTSARVLRDLGLISRLDGIPGVAEPELEKRRQVVETLGSLTAAFEIAAVNEMREYHDYTAIRPGGELVSMADAQNDKVFELSLLRNFARPDPSFAAGRKEMTVTFTANLFSGLHKCGYTVLPRIQSAVRGASMVTGRHPSLTWHSVDVGSPGQIHAKVGTLSGHVIIDKGGYSGWSTIAESSLGDLIAGVRTDVARRQFEHLQRTIIDTRQSKFAQNESDVPNVGKYVFLPMQVLGDTVAYHADLNCLALLKVMAEWVRGTDYTLLVKRHPRCTSDAVVKAIHAAVAEGGVVDTDASVHSLIAGASLVVTVNSGVGAEALLYLKPVISTGGSDYAAACVRARNRTQLLRVLNSGKWTVGTDDEIKRFLWFYTKRYMPHFTDKEAIRITLNDVLSAPATESNQPINAKIAAAS